jgi:hypothetical protein
VFDLLVAFGAGRMEQQATGRADGPVRLNRLPAHPALLKRLILSLRNRRLRDRIGQIGLTIGAYVPALLHTFPTLRALDD